MLLRTRLGCLWRFLLLESVLEDDKDEREGRLLGGEEEVFADGGDMSCSAEELTVFALDSVRAGAAADAVRSLNEEDALFPFRCSLER